MSWISVNVFSAGVSSPLPHIQQQNCYFRKFRWLITQTSTRKERTYFQQQHRQRRRKRGMPAAIAVVVFVDVRTLDKFQLHTYFNSLCLVVGVRLTRTCRIHSIQLASIANVYNKRWVKRSIHHFYCDCSLSNIVCPEYLSLDRSLFAFHTFQINLLKYTLLLQILSFVWHNKWILVLNYRKQILRINLV